MVAVSSPCRMRGQHVADPETMRALEQNVKAAVAAQAKASAAAMLSLLPDATINVPENPVRISKPDTVDAGPAMHAMLRNKLKTPLEG